MWARDTVCNRIYRYIFSSFRPDKLSGLFLELLGDGKNDGDYHASPHHH